MEHREDLEQGIAQKSDPAGDGTVPIGPQDVTGGGKGATGPAGATGTVGAGGATGVNPDREGTVETASKAAGVQNEAEALGVDE